MSGKERVRAYRERKRKQGLRPVTLWLPDLDSPEFKAEAHRQSLAVANSDHEKEDQAWVDAVSAEIWANLPD